MAKVPDFSPVMADSRVLGAPRADSGITPGLAAVPGQQMQQMGNSVAGLSDTALRIVTQMQQDINQTQVDDALNKAREATLKLTYDPEIGYAGIKGNDALTRPDGQSLPDEYGGKLQKTIDELSTGLGNDEQRRQFALRANDIATSFKGNIEAHTLQEFKSYSLSVQDGAIKLGQDEAKRNWADPLKVDTALSGVAAAVARAGKIQGKSASQIMFEMKTATSMVHLGVIEAALKENNPTYAAMYLEKNKGAMSADDILKVNGAINHDLDGRISQQAVGQTVSAMQEKFAPTDITRLRGIVKQLESGGDPNAVGPNVPGQGTAKGSMQVMDATNANPGFGVKPAKDNSPEERERVGNDYLQALVTKTGNVAMALAAYNAGPGKEGTKGYDKDGKPLPGLAPAIARAEAKGAPQNWLGELPKETQDYVQRGMAKYGTGQGAPAIPTEQEFVADAIARLGPNPRPSQLQITRTAAEHQYTIITKSIKEKADNVTQRAFEAIGRAGGIAGLDPQLRDEVLRYAPQKLDDLMAFSAKVAKGQPIQTDWSLYYKLKVDPQLLGSANLMAMRDKLSDAEFKSLSEEQLNIRQGKAGLTTQLRSSHDVVNLMMRQAGIDPTPEDTDKKGADKVGQVWAAVDARVAEAQNAIGRPLKPEEVGKVIAPIFTQVELPGMLWNSTTTAALVTPDQKVVVPTTDRNQIADALRAARKPVTDEAIQAIYRRKKGIQ